MKRIYLIFFFSMALLAGLSPHAAAAPSISLKTGAGAGVIGLSIGIPVADTATLMVQGGYFGYGWVAGAGLRYHFWRASGASAFICGTANAHYFDYDQYEGFVGSVYATGGLQFTGGGVHEPGLVMAVEAGAGLFFDPSFSESLLFPVIGISLGYQFQ